jgi:hypothetical protein
MKRHFPGLAQAGQSEENLPDGEYLVEVTRIKYRWHQQKPFYSLQFQVLAPEGFRSRTVAGRLYCSVKALWKLNWFLTDFGYDPELLTSDDIDEKAVVGLKGMLRLSQRSVNGRSFPNFEAFAPADRWNSHVDQSDSYGEEDLEQQDDREVA